MLILQEDLIFLHGVILSLQVRLYLQHPHIGALYRSKSLLPTHYRKMFVNALMLPKFDYLDIIYSRAGKTRLFELDLLYRKIDETALGV